MSQSPLGSRHWRNQRQRLLTFGLLCVLLLLFHDVVVAQAPQGTARPVRTLLPSEWEVPHPAGVTYSTALGQILMLEKNPLEPLPLTSPTVVAITPYEQLIGATPLNFILHDSINIAFADGGQRLFLLDQPLGKLAQVQIGATGLLDPATLVQTDIAWFGLNSPQGLSVDAESAYLFILDSAPPRIARVPLTPTGIDETQIQVLNLARTGIADPRGLAVHPHNQHLYIGSPAEQKLYQITQASQLVATYDLTPLSLVDQRGLVFAPSADLTDPPETIHLLVADSNIPITPTVPVSPTSAVSPANVAFSGARQMYLPVVAQPNHLLQVSTVMTEPQIIAPLFGKIVEASLECVTCTQTLSIPVTSDEDDAEERGSGFMKLDSSDLELTRDGTSQQTIGIRFAGVNLPTNALITHAYIEFETDEVAGDPTSLTIHGEAAAAAAPYADLRYDISSRQVTTACVTWADLPAWNTIREKQRTPDLTAVVHEIIARPDWVSGNPLAFVITGAGKRVAKAHDGNPAGAPRLVIEYSK